MCGLPVAILEFVVYRDPTGCLTAFYFSPFEVRDDSNPSGDGLSHLNRIKLGGAATKTVALTLKILGIAVSAVRDFLQDVRVVWEVRVHKVERIDRARVG